MARRGLTREAVLAAAVAMADDQGIDALTMRALAHSVGVEAMSLYHHVPNKEALLDGMIDRVFAEVALPPADGDWQEALAERSRSMRAALRRHPWALPLLESRRTPGPANLAYHEANIACLRAAGFTPRQVAHAYAVLDAFVYGFVQQEIMLPFDSGDEAVAMIDSEPMGPLIAAYPHMVWFTEHVILAPEYSFAREFEPGLTLVLDGIASHVTSG
ncbi:MAG: TetR/AcrR family transcriptional regulator C-terminal domain-containing protein [Phycicoccus sp.]|nr:TetR/AcrR family transcriptional regulator C-terminal domain-containing protein [Phycicoccus sp.]